MKRTLLPLFLIAVLTASAGADSPLVGTLDRVQPKVVKIYGAGGLRRLEPYQSGILISNEGHILTVFSYVLDTDFLTATLGDGRKFEAKLLGADPRLEVAVLKIDAADLPYFHLGDAAQVDAPARVLAVSNAFGVATGNEPASVQHGIVSVRTTLEARRGVFETVYHGPVYVLDAVTNNPGAAGGALVTRGGELIGLLGKELRNAGNNTWLNYAMPIDELRESVAAIRAGRFGADRPPQPREKPEHSLELELLGIVLVPDVLERTPPYVDQVRPLSPAARAGVRPDDLILLLGERLIQSCKILRKELQYVDFEDPIVLTVERGGELLPMTLQHSADPGRPSP